MMALEFLTGSVFVIPLAAGGGFAKVRLTQAETISPISYMDT